MNIFDDIMAARRRTECDHLWILKKDNTVFCYECGAIKTKK